MAGVEQLLQHQQPNLKIVDAPQGMSSGGLHTMHPRQP